MRRVRSNVEVRLRSKYDLRFCGVTQEKVPQYEKVNSTNSFQYFILGKLADLYKCKKKSQIEMVFPDLGRDLVLDILNSAEVDKV